MSSEIDTAEYVRQIEAEVFGIIRHRPSKPLSVYDQELRKALMSLDKIIAEDKREAK